MKIADLKDDIEDYDDLHQVMIRIEIDGIEYEAAVREVGFRNRCVVLYTDVDTVEKTDD